MLFFFLAQSLGSSGLPDDVEKNLQVIKAAYQLDTQIMNEYNGYEAIQTANQTDYGMFGEDELKSMEYLDLYHIDMDLVKAKLSLSNRPLIVELERTIEILAKQNGINPQLVKAIIRVESFYNPQAKSHKGACGLMQLMPATAKHMGVKDIFNPVDNIIGGIKYLKYLKESYKSEKLLLAAYNAGPGNVKRHRGVPPFPETIDYIKKVRKFKKEYEV